MYYSVQLRQDGTVKAIGKTPKKLEGENIIQIDGENMSGLERRQLLKKKYNRETGEFEDISVH